MEDEISTTDTRMKEMWETNCSLRKEMGNPKQLTNQILESETGEFKL